MNRIIRNIFILFVGGVVFNRLTLLLIGYVNKRFNFVESVFVAYPADEEYSDSYFFDCLKPLVKWSPFAVGIARQNGQWILMSVISATEADIECKDNEFELLKLKYRTDKLRELLGAPQMKFSGILPGVMFGKRIRREIPEAEVTVDAVCKAVEKVRKREQLPEDAPVIVLGGMGFIGRRLVKKLNGNTWCVDLRPGMEWPKELRGQQGIVVNVSRNAILTDYLDQLWSGLILVNEVYPEPSRCELDALERKSIPAYHVVGAKALALPPFPKAYQGGIPCCAALMNDDMEVLVRRL